MHQRLHPMSHEQPSTDSNLIAPDHRGTSSWSAITSTESDFLGGEDANVGRVCSRNVRVGETVLMVGFRESSVACGLIENGDVLVWVEGVGGEGLCETLDDVIPWGGGCLESWG